MKMSLGRVVALAAAPVLLLAAGAGSALAQPGSGGPPPPKGFEAVSASFVSAQTGFVLGTRHCSNLNITPCRALLEKTTNGGKTWTPVPTPAVDLQVHYAETPASAVSSVRFANAKDGWLFGPALWATTNGGKTWQRVKVPGVFYMMAASGGEAYAAAFPALQGPLQGHLYESVVGSGKWSLVPKVAPTTELTSFGRSAWTGTADRYGDGGQVPVFWTTTNGGKTWSKLSFKCPVAYPSASEVAASSVNNVAIACDNPSEFEPGSSPKQVVVSANGGRTFHAVAANPPAAGQVYGLAMAVGNPKVITINSASGASYLYETVNGGKAWTNSVPVQGIDAGLGFADLQYASSTTGYVIHFMGSPVIAYGKGLMKTTNAGRTWTSVSIP